MTIEFRIVPAGDAALIAEFPDRIDLSINAAVVALAQTLETARIPGVRDIVPAYRSVAVHFDPLRTDYSALADRLHGEASRAAVPPPQTGAGHIRRVPVCYGGEFGPDLPAVARFAALTEAEVVERHTSPTYRVFMLGFLPGFPYMGIVDPRIAAPRLSEPRTHVPAGAVGIAGRQTGIYPAETPGGWQIIGRTPLQPYDLRRPEPFLFKAGDAVEFYAITAAEHNRLSQPRR